jgi:hypothetical protein
MPQVVVTGNYPATLLVQGNYTDPTPTLISNQDANNTIYIGSSSSVNPANPYEANPIPPGQFIVVTGIIDVYGVCLPGLTALAYVLPEATSIFQPGNSLTVGTFPNPQVELKSQGGIGYVIFFTNDSLEASPGHVIGVVEGSGSTRSLAVSLRGPTATSQADFVSTVLLSSNATPSAFGAQEEFIYNDPVGRLHQYASNSAAGFVILAGSIAAVTPGTGTPTTPATSESWHYLTPNSGWSNFSSSYQPLRYRLLPIGQGIVEVIAELSSNTATGLVATLPSGYIPTYKFDGVALNVSNNTVAHVLFDSTGGINAEGWGTGGSIMSFHVFIPLD